MKLILITLGLLAFSTLCLFLRIKRNQSSTADNLFKHGRRK